MELLPKKWFVEVTNENKEVLNKWRLSQPDVNTKYNDRFKEGCCIISDGWEGDKSYFFASGKSLLIEYGVHVEISYEDFVKYVLTIDYTIPGTKLPLIPEGTLKRCAHWEDSADDVPFYYDKVNYISFGSKMFKGHLYILCERSSYTQHNYFMVKLSDIERLAKEQNLITKSKENMKQITSAQAQQIIDIACSAWKDKLATKWGRKIVFKETIEISDNDYQEMRKACTAPQNELFDDIFGKDVMPYKVGDWVVGWFCKNDKYSNKAWQIGEIIDKYIYPSTNLTHNTDPIHLRLATEEEITKAKIIPEGVACLVRDEHHGTWKLAYSNGKGKFISGGGSVYSWDQVQILDVNNLPKY